MHSELEEISGLLERRAAHRRRLPDRPLRPLRAAGRLPRGASGRGDPHGRGDPGRCAGRAALRRLDCAFAALDPDALGTSSRRRALEGRACGGPAARASALRASPRSRFEELAAEDLIAYRENSALRRRLERVMAERDLEPRNPFVCTEMAAVRGLASKGLGVTVIPRSVRRAAGAADRAAANRTGAADVADRPGLASDAPPGTGRQGFHSGGAEVREGRAGLSCSALILPKRWPLRGRNSVWIIGGCFEPGRPLRYWSSRARRPADRPPRLGRAARPARRRARLHPSDRHQPVRMARGVESPQDIVLSPDGRHAYVASYGSNAVAVFARDRRSGALEQLPGASGCVRHERGGSCSAARALARPSSVAISADGANLYVASAGSDALAVFARDRRRGTLRQLAGTRGCMSQRPGGGCLVGRALNEPTSVAVSPDGNHVYVAGRRFPSAVAALSRAADGSLTQPGGSAGCVSQAGVSGCALRARHLRPGRGRGQSRQPPRAGGGLAEQRRRDAQAGSRRALPGGRPGGLHREGRRRGLCARALDGGTRGPGHRARRPWRVRGLLDQRRRGRAPPRQDHRRARASRPAVRGASARTEAADAVDPDEPSTRCGASP